MRIVHLLIVLLGFYWTVPAVAQTFPSKPVTIIVASTPGGPPDILARSLQPRLEKQLGQSVVIDYRPGAGGYIGAEVVVRANPDGHTLLLNSFGALHSEIFFKDQSSVLSRDLVPIAPVADSPLYLIAPTTLPVKNLKEFIAYVKASPKKLNVGIFPSSTPHLATLLFLQRAGLDMVVVPYNSNATIMPDIARGEIVLYMVSASGAKPLIDDGKILPLAVTSDQRTPLFPDVPTAKEEGYDSTDSSYFSLLAPVRTPANIVQKLNEMVAVALRDPEVWATWNKLGFIQASATPEQMAEKLKSENRKYHEIANTAGIKPQ